MKKLLVTLFLGLLCMAAIPESAHAQGLYTPSATDTNASATDGFVLGDTSRMVKIYGPFNGTITTATVGVYYTKGAAVDTLTTVQLFHALDYTALNAGYGEVLTTDATLQYNNSAASEYQEQTVTISGGAYYLGIKIVPDASATDTTTVKPFLFLK